MTPITIGEICNKDVKFVAPETTVLRAAQLMRELHVGDLVIVDEDDGIRLPVGIVTDRDIVVAAVASELDLRTLAVGDLSMYPLVTVGADLSVQEVVAEILGGPPALEPHAEKGGEQAIRSIRLDRSICACHRERSPIAKGASPKGRPLRSPCSRRSA